MVFRIRKPYAEVMALKTCRECGKEISSRADKCPHCGYRRSRVLTGCLLIVLPLVIVYLLALMAH